MNEQQEQQQYSPNSATAPTVAPATLSANVPAAPAPILAAPPERNPMRRILIINGLALLVLVLIALGIFYIWHQGYYFYSTDDATVSGASAQVASVVPGSVATIFHGQGGTVRAGAAIAALRTASGGTVNVTSPINGTIIQETAIPGAVVGAGQPIAQVVDLSRLYITAYVEETHIKDVAVNQGVDVTVDSISNTTFHGTVTRILPFAASELSLLPTNDYASGNFTKVTQRIPVQITLDGYQGHTLYPGASASVTIHIHQ